MKVNSKNITIHMNIAPTYIPGPWEENKNMVFAEHE